MRWTGKWRNQYGSVFELTEEGDGRVAGTFQTALKDSNFYGQTLLVVGMASGDVIGLAAAAEGTTGPAALTYAGIVRQGKLETLWHTVVGSALVAEREGAPAVRQEVGAWRAFATNLDTFERLG